MLENIIELPKTVGAALIVVIAMILVDFLLAIFISLKEKTFDFKKLPQFVCSSILPYVGGLLVLAIVAQYVENCYTELFLSVAGLVAIKYLVDVKDKIIKLFGVTLK